MVKKLISGVLIFVFLNAGHLSGQDVITYHKARLTAVHNTVVAAEAPGIVRKIIVETGDDVVESAILVQLNRESFEGDYNVAIEEEHIAKLHASNHVDIQFAKKSTEVNRKLVSRSEQARQSYEKSVTQTDLDRLQLELQQSQLSIEQAELNWEVAQLTSQLRTRMREVAEVNLANRDIKAPYDGRVTQVYVQLGQWVNGGEPIARVTNLKSLRIKAFFSKDSILKIKKGSKAVFEFEIGDQSYQIPVDITYVGSEIVDDIFQVWADVDNSEGKLIPGMSGRLTVSLTP